MQQRPKSYWLPLFEKLTDKDLKEYPFPQEPLLSFALQNPDDLLFLLEKGLSVDQENDFGKTALFYAIGDNNLKAVEILLAHHADVNHKYFSAEKLRSENECNYPNLQHTLRSPLMHAAQHSDVDMLKLLLNHGAKLHDVDELNESALNYAEKAGKQKNVQFLKEQLNKTQ